MTAIHLHQEAGLYAKFRAELDGAAPLRDYIQRERFNDDDLYVWIAETGELVREIGAKSVDATNARYFGLRVEPGQTWAKGMSAKYAKLWRRV